MLFVEKVFQEKLDRDKRGQAAELN